MKICTCAILLLVTAGVLSTKGQAVTDSQLPRITKTINTNWTFNYFPSESADKGYEVAGFDDSRWQAISVPHTWNTAEFAGNFSDGNSDNASTDNPYWRNGWGWYRKSFIIDPAYNDRKVFIEFDGVQNRCKVWINGVYLGDHTGGAASFGFDLTPHIRKGVANVIAIAVNNNVSTGKESDPLFYGGIYRNVRIVLKNKLYIPFQGSSGDEDGTAISIPGFAGKPVPVTIQTMVKNDHSQPMNCVVQSTIYDARGKLLQQVRSSQEIKPGQSFLFDNSTKPVSNPQLWSPDNPYLYKVLTEVFNGKVVSDSISDYFGFRWFSLEGDNFYLNGKPYRLQGDKFDGIQPWIGNALPGNIIEDDFREAKNKKMNFRIASIPAGQHAYSIADRLGIIIFQTDQVKVGNDHPSVFLTPADRLQKIPVLRTEPTMNGKAGAGEPARIILTSLQKSIPARPGSVAIINSSITDSKGNITESKKTLKWTIEGPASLLPVSSGVNIIRCTGEPGKIKVTAFAPALASGTVEISSMPAAETAAAIAEPVLREQGRAGSRTLIKPARLEPVPQELKFFSEAVTLSSSNKPGYNKLIGELLHRNNPLVDTASAEFRSLTYVLGTHLYNNNGQISAADINYNIDHFNNCLLIAGYINATKLPQPFKDGLRIYYSQSMIIEGEEKNAGDEMNWLNWIPSGGTVVYFDESPKPAMVKGTLITPKNDLIGIITLVYPEFTRLSEDAKTRAIDFIARMNPWVHPVQGSVEAFTADRGKPVLIPLFKFIAE